MEPRIGADSLSSRSCHKSFGSFARRAIGHGCACSARAPRCACTRIFRSSAVPLKTLRAGVLWLRARARTIVQWKPMHAAPMTMSRSTLKTCSRMVVPEGAGHARTSCPVTVQRCVIAVLLQLGWRLRRQTAAPASVIQAAHRSDVSFVPADRGDHFPALQLSHRPEAAQDCVRRGVVCVCRCCCAMSPTHAVPCASRKSAVLLFDEAHNLVRLVAACGYACVLEYTTPPDQTI